MAVLLPELSERELDALSSSAEARFYRACRSLPPGVVVLHAIGGTWTAADGSLCDGEADFVFLDAAWGMLVVEVKGGGIARDSRSGKWQSIDRHGRRHPIKDPFAQASRQKYALLDTLRNHPDWPRGRRINIGHAVAFPDIGAANRPVTAGVDPRLVATGDDLTDLLTWWEATCAAWGNSEAAPGREGLAELRRLLAGPVQARPLVRLRLSAEEEVRIRLTSQQMRVLDFTEGHPRTSTAGGAGTGKTVLAVEKARRLATAGLRTALLCHNRPLADDLQRKAGHIAGLDVLGFHQLCWREATAVGHATGRDLFSEAREADPLGDEFGSLYPLALSLSIGEEGSSGGYDAVVVDEGQDFNDQQWMAVDDLLYGSKRAELHVFYDANQAVYGAWKSPLKELPFQLSVNCRSTRQIHEAAYRHFQGTPTRSGELEGPGIRRIEVSGVPEQAGRIARDVTRLLREEEVQPHQVVVLVADESPTWHLEELTRHGLPAGVRWQTPADTAPEPTSAVRCDSVRRFKGLESEIVFLWGIDDLTASTHRARELLYVGLSRAISELILVAAQPTLDSILSVQD